MSVGRGNIVVPDGFTLHTENTSHILLASDEVFLNPIQEFNRDVSVACIRTWSDELNEIKEARWNASQERKAKTKVRGAPEKKRKVIDGTGMGTHESPTVVPTSDYAHVEETYKPYTFTLLEALSATGLRSIRYAKEIPLVNYVIANDLSRAAVEAMKRNVVINGFGPTEDSEGNEKKPGKIRVNEGDACSLMYSHRDLQKRVDVVDLDPYGTAAPFIDAAVQSINDGGLLCVTCTDLSVLATTNYPEKCFSNYGGVPVKAEYCHESALRLVIHSLSTSAARYGRCIEPLVSLSIDFYVRIFVRVKISPLEVKRAVTKTSTYYVCSYCQTPHEQPLGKLLERKHEESGNVNYLFKLQGGPSTNDRCSECHSVMHIAGPMWSGPLHDQAFLEKVLKHLEENKDHYGTHVRVKGMLTVAKEELSVPFYFTPAKISSFFHCITPPLADVASALLHAGHRISRSHACPGSLKTDAPRALIHDVFRNWIKRNPVKMEKISEKSPALVMLAKDPSFEANFSRHPGSVTSAAEVKLVRYQENPTPYWGPGTKASGSKRKRTQENDG